MVALVVAVLCVAAVTAAFWMLEYATPPENILSFLVLMLGPTALLGRVATNRFGIARVAVGCGALLLVLGLLVMVLPDDTEGFGLPPGDRQEPKDVS